MIEQRATCDQCGLCIYKVCLVVSEASLERQEAMVTTFNLLPCRNWLPRAHQFCSAKCLAKWARDFAK